MRSRERSISTPVRAPSTLRGWTFLLLLCAVTLWANASGQDSRWTIDVSTGTSGKIPNSLLIEQDGYGISVVSAVAWETRPWLPLHSFVDLAESYYAFRVTYRPAFSRIGYGLEFLHDKAYFLTGTDPDGIVDHFELSDGHNMLFGQVSYGVEVDELSELVLRAGAGPAISNPSTIIRGKRMGTRTGEDMDSRYYVTGFGAQLSLQYRFDITDWLALSNEVRYVYSWLRIPINGGRASTAFNSFHVELGLSFRP